MSCCVGGELIIRCGETFSLDIENRDAETDDLLPLLPKARGTIRIDSSMAALLTFGSDTGEIVVDASAGTAVLTLDSDATATLSPDNSRVEAWLAIEFYDDGQSPELVESYPPETIIIQPDFV